jgi:hypothetical protein
MATYRIPSLSEMHEMLVAVFRGAFPDRNTGSKRSYHVRRLRFLAAAATSIHAHVKSAKADVMPDTASDGEPINRWGGIRGVERKGATPARKTDAGRVTGAVGATVLAGTELEEPNSGLRFAINQLVTIPVSEEFDADIVALDTGSQTRLTAGRVLRFVGTPPAGISSIVTLVKDLDEDGFDAEQFGSYRERVLASFSKPTSGGTDADFVKWALEVNDIAKAFAYGNRAGIGTMDVVGLHTGTGAARILDSGERDELLTYLRSKAPAQIAAVGGALRALEVVEDPQDIEIAVVPNGEPAYAFDWADQTPPTITGWNAGTREMTLDVRPPGLKAGHRIVIDRINSEQDGRQYKVEALSGADKIILEKAPIAVPATGPVLFDIIYSGGPLVDPIRNAILEHVNGEDVYMGRDGTPYPESAIASVVGLALLAEGMGPANPAGRYGSWAGGLIKSQLGKIAGFKRGVYNHAVIKPAADYEATDDAFPNDAQIHMVTPRSVVVRRGW